MRDWQANIISPVKKLSFKNKLHKIFIAEKLYNSWGIALLFSLSVALAFITAYGGLSAGILTIVLIIALPLVYAIIAYPRLGIIVLLVLAYFLFYILRFGVNFPVGTLMDGLQVLLIAGFFLSQKEHPNWKIFKNPVSILFVTWIVYNIIEVANPSAESGMAWLYTIRSIAIVSLMYFIFVYYINSVFFIRIIVVVWIIMAFIGALYGYIQEYFGYSNAELAFINSDPLITSLYFVQGHWRKFSIFSDPVAFAYNMVAASFLCIALLFYYKNTWMKLLLLFLAVFFLGSMLYSGTRGAFVLLPAGLLLLAILKFNRWILLISIITGSMLVALIFVPTSNVTLVRFQSAFKPSTDASYIVRKQNQQKIQPYILSHPLGGGLGSTGVWGQRFTPNSYLANFPPDSGYVRVAVELGWVGLLLFCILMFVILKTGISNYYHIKNPELKTYCFAMVLIVFAYNIGNYPQEAIVQFPSSILFYLATALIIVTMKLDQETKLPLHEK